MLAIEQLKTFQVGDEALGGVLRSSSSASEFNYFVATRTTPHSFYLNVNFLTVQFQGYKGKVKVKLSLCLTKHHTMKAYWGSGGIAPLIL
jgi:hypothetical protein